MDIEKVREVLLERKTGILALQAGGCARYIHSRYVRYCFDREGWPLIGVETQSDFRRHFLTNSTLSLAIDFDTDGDGAARTQLVLVGQLTDITAHDREAVARYRAYFGDGDENAFASEWRLYRFQVHRAHLALESGQQIPYQVAELLPKNPFSAREEQALIRRLDDAGHHLLASGQSLGSPPPSTGNGTAEIVGLDSFGADIRIDGHLYRTHFERPVTSVAEFEERCAADVDQASSKSQEIQ